MAIDALPTPTPTRGMIDTVFSPAVDAFLGAMPVMVNQINAAVAAMNLASTNSTSTTSMLIAIATKTFTVEVAKSYVAGQTLKVAYTTDPTQWMLGDVISYNVSTGVLVMSITVKQGSGTYAAWTISLSAPAQITIPAGSKTVWFQATAPLGWTQDVAALDHAIRLVSGAGGGYGGSVGFSTCMGSRGISGSNSAVTLTKAQIPTHAHTYSETHTGSGNGLGGSAPLISTGNIMSTGNGSADGVGSSGSHNHTFTGTNLDLRILYLDMILCSKD